MLPTIQISTKYKVIGSAAALATAFAFGRYSAPVTPTVKTHEITNTSESMKKDQDTHKKISITKKPDGTVITDITVDTDTKTDANKNTDLKLDQTVTPPKRSTLNVSALGGYDFRKGPVYGGSVSKEVLGPITIGGFGLTNGTVGVSIGLNF